MVVKLRLMRLGRRNLPFYRLVATDIRSPRDGKNIELLGHYDPFAKDAQKEFIFKDERVKYWLSVGAQPSAQVALMLQKMGTTLPAKKRRDRSGRKKSRSAKKDFAVKKRRSARRQKRKALLLKKTQKPASTPQNA